MPKYDIMLYYVLNLTPNIIYVKFDTQNSIVLEKIFCT